LNRNTVHAYRISIESRYKNRYWESSAINGD
jgi:hypothetical protein